MNIFQKITGLITLVCISATLAVLFICFDTPFHAVVLTEICALIFSELILGSIGIFLYGRDDRSLPYALTLWIPGILYFGFVLIMIYPASGPISVSRFILLHIFGCAAWVVGTMLFQLGKHSHHHADTASDTGMRNKESMIRKMSEAHTLFSDGHPRETELLTVSEKLLDSFRFASVSASTAAEYDARLLIRLDELKELATGSAVDQYRQKLQEIKKMFLLRERM